MISGPCILLAALCKKSCRQQGWQGFICCCSGSCWLYCSCTPGTVAAASVILTGITAEEQRALCAVSCQGQSAPCWKEGHGVLSSASIHPTQGCAAVVKRVQQCDVNIAGNTSCWLWPYSISQLPKLATRSPHSVSSV
jgi:hypothetical protein